MAREEELGDPRFARDAPHPWAPFFKRAEGMATAAFLTIPYVGEGIADFFNSVVVPRFTPPRDRALALLGRGLKSVEGRLAAALLRLMPLPPAARRGGKKRAPGLAAEGPLNPD